jgi:hypothetical protein
MNDSQGSGACLTYLTSGLGNEEKLGRHLLPVLRTLTSEVAEVWVDMHHIQLTEYIMYVRVKTICANNWMVL